MVEQSVGVAWCRLHAETVAANGPAERERRGKSSSSGGCFPARGSGNHAVIIKSTLGRAKRVKCLKFVLIAIHRLSFR